MRIPTGLASLAEFGVIEEVVRPLMSGKEAQIFLVTSGGKECIAKVYKEAQDRAFRNRAEYTEGRRTRNTRDHRAMGKRTRHGRAQDEGAWRSAEVDMIYRLREAGVRVPKPYRAMDGVLLMELITDEDGDPAPRLGDVDLDPETATAIYRHLVGEVVRMLAAGVVHGDLSDFNVLLGAEGPVLIDFPQAVDASRNPNARKLLVRDVDNLHRFLLRFVPDAKICRYAEEMWELYETSALSPDTQLAGTWRPSTRRADVATVLHHIDDAEWDELRRRESRGLPAGALAQRRRPAAESARPERPRGPGPRPAAEGAPPAARAGTATAPEGAGRPRRRRRRGRSRPKSS